MKPLFPVLVLVAAGAGCASSHAITPQVAGPGVDFAQATPFEVQLSNFHFVPSTLQFQAGRPYALTLNNTASKAHTFTAPDFFAAAKIAPDEAAQVADGEVEVRGHQSVTLHLVPGAGQYKLECTELGHAALGMTGRIVVR